MRYFFSSGSFTAASFFSGLQEYRFYFWARHGIVCVGFHIDLFGKVYLSFVLRR
jgi:hypothetical protein